jgi:hypothetical protein
MRCLDRVADLTGIEPKCVGGSDAQADPAYRLARVRTYDDEVVGWNPPLLGNGRCNLAQAELDDPVGEDARLRKKRLLGHERFQGDLRDRALGCEPQRLHGSPEAPELQRT